MKYLIIALLFVSCTKHNIFPTGPLKISKVTYFFLKDGINLSFTAKNDNNVAYYEIFSGDDGHQLCIEYKLRPNKQGLYTYLSPIVKSYYMIGYKLKDSTLRFDEQMIKITRQP